jgi:uncharacterized protein YjdB
LANLVETIVSEYINNIQGTSLNKGLTTTGSLSSTDLAYLRATIINKIKADNLYSSGAVDQILPSMMKGVTQGARLLSLTSLSGETRALANIIGIATSSSVQSAMSRPNAVTAGSSTTLSDVVNSVMTQGVVGLQATVSSDPVSMKAALSAAIQTVATQADILATPSFTSKDAVTAAVEAAITAVTSTTTSSSVSSVVMEAVLSGAAQSFASKSTAASDLQAILTSALNTAAVNDPTTLTLLITQASVGLSEGLSQGGSGLSTAALTNVLTNAAGACLVTVDATAITAATAVLNEAQPTASFPVASNPSTVLPYVQGGSLVTINWSAGGDTSLGYKATLTSPTDTLSGGTFSSSAPGGVSTVTAGGATSISGSWTGTVGAGSHTFLLQVANTGGYKATATQLVVRMAAPSNETAPTAVLNVFTNGTTPVPASGNLPYAATGYDLTLNSAGSSSNVTTALTSDGIYPIVGTGPWTVHVDPNSTTTFTLAVKNNPGTLGTTTAKVITVAAASQVVNVTGVTVSPTTLAMAVGGPTQKLTATVSPTNATNRSVAWTTSNSSVATVDINGVVTAKAAGTATVTVTSVSDGTKKATVSVTVSSTKTLVTGITIQPSSLTIGVTPGNNQAQLLALVAPTNATNKALSWKSDNPSIATVDSTGLVTGRIGGTAHITATAIDGSKVTSSPVTVTVNDGYAGGNISLPDLEGTIVISGPEQLIQGETGTYQAMLTGIIPDHFDWYIDGNPVEGTTGDTLVIPTNLLGAGTTHLITAQTFDVSDPDIVYSGSATIAVAPPDGALGGSLNLEPVDLPTVDVRGPAQYAVGSQNPIVAFSAWYSGSAASYQWYIDGKQVDGATSSAFFWDSTGAGADHLIAAFVQDSSDPDLWASGSILVKATQ